MIHPIKSFRSFVEDIKIAFRLFIGTVENLRATVENLRASVEANTTTIEANSVKVDALAAEQKELRKQFYTLTEHSGYLVTEKRRELIRAGHHS